MRRSRAISAMFLLLALVFVASIAWAAVNFRNAGFTVLTGGSLDCSWDVSGLGTSPIDVSCTVGTATAHYQCVNRGGNPPPPQTFTGVALQNTVGPITPTKNGRASGDVPVQPPPPGTCPDGMSTTLLDVTYTSLRIDVFDHATGVSLASFDAPNQSVSCGTASSSPC